MHKFAMMKAVRMGLLPRPALGLEEAAEAGGAQAQQVQQQQQQQQQQQGGQQQAQQQGQLASPLGLQVGGDSWAGAGRAGRDARPACAKSEHTSERAAPATPCSSSWTGHGRGRLAPSTASLQQCLL